MIRALFILSLTVAAVSAFVTPVNHAAGELKEAHIFSPPKKDSNPISPAFPVEEGVSERTMPLGSSKPLHCVMEHAETFGMMRLWDRWAVEPKGVSGYIWHFC